MTSKPTIGRISREPSRVDMRGGLELLVRALRSRCEGQRYHRARREQTGAGGPGMAPIAASVARSSMPEMPNPRPQPNPRPSPRPTPRVPGRRPSSTPGDRRRARRRGRPRAPAHRHPRRSAPPRSLPHAPLRARRRATRAPRSTRRRATRSPRSTRRGTTMTADPRSFNIEPTVLRPDIEIIPDSPPAIIEPSVDQPGGAEPPARSGRSRFRRRGKWVAFAILSVLTILALAFVGLGWRSYRKIERVAVKSALSEHVSGGTNYLIVGSDSREGIAEDDPNTEVFGEDTGPARTDTIVILHVGSRRQPHVAVAPRPVHPDRRGQGSRPHQHRDPGRAGEVDPDGATEPRDPRPSLRRDGFRRVPRIGRCGRRGRVIDFDAPAIDQNSGLDIKTAGPHKLDRDQALAYVRSRHYTRIIDGKKVVDPTADLGRIERQQMFFRAVMSKVGDTRNPADAASHRRRRRRGPPHRRRDGLSRHDRLRPQAPGAQPGDRRVARQADDDCRRRRRVGVERAGGASRARARPPLTLRVVARDCASVGQGWTRGR